MGVQAVEELRERAGDFEIADRVAADVRAELVEEARVVVAEGAEVELLDPAAFGVHQGELEHHGGLELQAARAAFSGLPVRILVEDAFGFRSSV